MTAHSSCPCYKPSTWLDFWLVVLGMDKSQTGNNKEMHEFSILFSLFGFFVRLFKGITLGKLICCMKYHSG